MGLEFVYIRGVLEYFVKLPFDGTNYYCPVCGYCTGEWAFYGTDGFAEEDSCCVCGTFFGQDDVPSQDEDGVWNDHELVIQGLRRSWLETEGYSESPRHQLRDNLGIFVEIPSHRPGSGEFDAGPMIVRWKQRTEEYPCSSGMIGVWEKHMLNRETGLYIVKIASGLKAGNPIAGGTLEGDHLEDLVSAMLYELSVYLADPPDEVVWR